MRRLASELFQDHAGCVLNQRRGVLGQRGTNRATPGSDAVHDRGRGKASHRTREFDHFGKAERVR